jgi:hypothetical protein
LVAARALGEEAQRLYYAQDLAARQVVLISTQMALADPKYSGRAPESIVHMLRRVQENSAALATIGEGSNEERLLAVLNAHKKVRDGYVAHISTASSLLLMNSGSADLAAQLKQMFLSGAASAQTALDDNDREIALSLQAQRIVAPPALTAEQQALYGAPDVATMLESRLPLPAAPAPAAEAEQTAQAGGNVGAQGGAVTPAAAATLLVNQEETAAPATEVVAAAPARSGFGSAGAARVRIAPDESDLGGDDAEGLVG